MGLGDLHVDVAIGMIVVEHESPGADDLALQLKMPLAFAGTRLEAKHRFFICGYAFQRRAVAWQGCRELIAKDNALACELRSVSEQHYRQQRIACLHFEKARAACSDKRFEKVERA